MEMRKRSAFPGVEKFNEQYGDLGWPLLRISYALFFVPHGCQKLFGWFGGNIQLVARAIESMGLQSGLAWAYVIGTLEVFGGILLALGLFTRPVALLFAGFMYVAAFHYYSGFGYFWTIGGMEVPLLMMLLALALAIRGGGEFSLDRQFGRQF